MRKAPAGRFCLCLALLFILFAPLSHAQDIPEWVLQEGHENKMLIESKVDSHENLYVFGFYYNGPVAFGVGQPNEIILEDDADDENYGDYFLAMYNPEGQLQWARRMKVNHLGVTTSHAWFDGDFNVYVCGALQTYAVFGEGEANETELRSNTMEDIFVAKYACSGNLVWATRIDDLPAPGIMSISWASDIKGDGDGNIYVTGLYKEILTPELLRRGDFTLLKFDTDGNLIWQYVDDPNPDIKYEGKQIAISDDYVEVLDSQNLIRRISLDGQALGKYSVVVDNPAIVKLIGEGEYYTAQNINGGYPYNYYLSKYNVANELIWALMGESEHDDAEIDFVDVDNNGNVHVLGKASGYTRFIDNSRNYVFSFSFDGQGRFYLVYDTEGYLLSSEMMDNFPVNHLALGSERGLVYTMGRQTEDVVINNENYPFSADRQLLLTRMNRGNAIEVSGVTFFYPSHKMISTSVQVFQGLGQVVADNNGYYRYFVPRNWSGQIMASHTLAYEFANSPRTLENVTEDKPLQDFWVLTPQIECSESGVLTQLELGETFEATIPLSNTGAAELNWSASASLSSLYFDGLDDYVRIPDSDVLDAISGAVTIDAWVKPSGAFTEGYIVDRSDSGNDRLSLSVMQTDHTFAQWSINDHVLQGGWLPMDAYSHVAGTYDGAMMRLYINGRLCDSLAVVTTIDVKDADLYMGSNAAGDHAFCGVISDVHLWDHARSRSELQSDMHVIVASETPGLVAYWPLEQMQGSFENPGTSVTPDSGPHKLFGLVGEDPRKPQQLNSSSFSFDWLTFNPASGTVAEGGASSLQMAISSENLAVGYHRAKAAILSNDPLKPSVSFPVNLEVLSNPTLSGRLAYSEGDVPIQGATVTISGQDDEVLTDGEGKYTIEVNRGWSGTIMPSKVGHAFTPASRSYTEIETPLFDQNFTVIGADTIHLSGQVLGVDGQGLVGAIVYYGEEDSVLTTAEGAYTFAVPHGWSGTIRPVKNDFVFDPVYKQLSSQNSDRDGIDFQSLGPVAVRISGHVFDPQNAGIPLVPVYYGTGGDSVLTDAEGAYTLQVPGGWSGDVAPCMPGWVLEDSTLSYENLRVHTADQDFHVLGPARVQIGGKVAFADGQAVSGAVLSATDQTGPFVSDDTGAYLITVPFGWSGRVAIQKQGYVFSPEWRDYTDLAAHQGSQDYTVQGVPVMALAGRVKNADGTGLKGVPLYYNEDQDTVQTGTDGLYLIEVPLGWGGIVTPRHEGLLFSPESRTYTEVDRFYNEQDYEVQGPALVQVSGTARYLPGQEPIQCAVLRWGVDGDSVLTDAEGAYAIQVANGWSGTVTIAKANHVFDPASRAYTDLKNHQVDQDFGVSGLALVPISGKVTNFGGEGVAGVAMVYGETDSVLTAEDGAFAFTVPHGWTGVLRPRKPGHVFDRSYRGYTALKTGFTGQNFVDLGPEQIVISGRAVFHPGGEAIGGVMVRTSDGDSALTDAQGRYALQVANGWAGTLTPAKANHVFDPPWRTLSALHDDVSDMDFRVNASAMVTLSGKVLSASGAGQAGVVLHYGETDTVHSRLDGSYSLAVAYGWSGQVHPDTTVWVASPAVRHYSVLAASQTAQDFQILGPAQVMISGRVDDGSGDGVADVQIYLGAHQDSLLTTADGAYSFTVPYGWSGDVCPQKDGMAFSPAKRSYAAVDTHQVDQDFAMFTSTAPRCLIVTLVAQPGWVSILDELECYAQYQADLPADLASFDLVLYADTAAAQAGHAAVLSGYLSGGGSAIFMDATPAKLAGTGGNLGSIAPWFGASTLTFIQSAQAEAVVDQPLGTALITGDVLATAGSADAAALMGLSADVIRLGCWDAGETYWQALARVHGSGKLGYWSHLETGNAAAVTLFKALVAWALSEDTAVDDEAIALNRPEAFELLPAYPNPFNPSTTLTYRLDETANVRLMIYDLSGRKVMTFDEGLQPAGTHQVVWRACDETGNGVASGLYIVRITAGKEIRSQKLVFLK